MDKELKSGKSAGRIVAVNIAVTLVLLVVANIAAGIWLDLSEDGPRDGALDPRIPLPAFEDKEWAAGFFNDFYQTTFNYAPYEGYRLKRMETGTVNVGDDGFRETPGGTAGGWPLRFFGGSTMWGTGAADSGTIPALVQQQFPTAEAINHAQSGYISGQEVAGLLRIAMRGDEMGTVVFYDGVNDVLLLCRGRATVDGHGLENRMSGALRRAMYGEGETSHLWTATVGNIFELALPSSHTVNIGDVSAEKCGDDPSRIDAAVSVLIRNWETARTIVETNGGDFIAALQPVSSVGTPRRDYLPETAEWDVWYRKAYALIRSRVGDQPWFVDLSDAVDGDEAVYIDWAHMTEKGNARVAERLVTVLMERTAAGGGQSK